MIPINERGRLPDQLPLFRGHTSVVLDTDWYIYQYRNLSGCLFFAQEPVQ